MPKATITGGSLVPIEDCYLDIPNFGKIIFDNLPEITDSKSASYNDEVVIGRASPLKTYSQSDNRTIALQIHFFVSRPNDIQENLSKLRAIESATYPREDGTGPYTPPPICKLKCGQLLSSDSELCVVCKSYSVRFPTDIAWAEDVFTPYKFDVDTTWDVVYRSSDLPGQDRILQSGR